MATHSITEPSEQTKLAELCQPGESTQSEDENSLERLLLDEDFLSLSAAQPFNLFEAMGMARAEIRHSHFLAHLLNPSGSHGLGDRLLRDFLTHVCRGHPTFRVVDVQLADFDDVVVERERFNIDILISCPSQKFVCAIENKIGTGEHDDQLNRYRRQVQQEFSRYDHKIFVYLTADGDAPSDDAYVALSYNEVLRDVERAAKQAASPDIRLMLDHYAILLRTHVVNDQEKISLCRRIYARHQRAIELVMEHGVVHSEDRIAEIVGEAFAAQIKAQQLVQDKSTPRTFRFGDPVLDQKAWFLTGTWSTSKRLMFFELGVRQDGVVLTVHIGPGTMPLVRERLHKALAEAGFRNAKLYPSWFNVYKKVFVAPEDYESFESDRSAVEVLVRQRVESGLEDFARKELEKIRLAVESVDVSDIWTTATA